MKNLVFLIATFALTSAGASAQILADFYSTAYSQSPATAQDYINDGITVPTSTGVSAFNLYGNGRQLTSITSNDSKLTATVSAGSAYEFESDQYTQSPKDTGNDPLYQSGALTFSTMTYTISGLLADGLQADSTYHLYLQGSNYTDVSGDFTLSYTYGTQSSGPTDPTGGNGFGSKEFTFTTGAKALDSIELTIAKASSNSVPYPAITSFAIVETRSVPEPATWAMVLVGGAALILLRLVRRSMRVS